MKIMNLLERLLQGWLWPNRAKKAHYFINRKSLCKKHIISEYRESGLLPSNMMQQQDCCKICLDKLNKTAQP